MAGKVTVVADRVTGAHKDFSTQLVTFTADDADATLDTGEVGHPAGNALEHPVLERIEFVAGGTAFTATADLTIKTADGFDLLEGNGDNIGDTDTLIKVALLFDGPLTLSWAATNAVNSATGVVKLYYKKVV